MKQVEADVVVIAAGTAGMAAAIAAAENGANVIVFEKASTFGGSGNIARGPFAVESKLQKMRKIPLTREEVFKIHMDYTHWKVDARLVSEYINKSASTIDWLEKMGVEFIDVQSHNYGYNFTWHIIKGPLVPRGIPGTGVVMMKIMFDKAIELGVKVYFRTPAKKILKEGNRVTGVIAENKFGETLQADTNAVIIASGGYGDSPGMIKEHAGFNHGEDMFVMKDLKLTGDGIRMAWKAGAAKGTTGMHMIYNVPGPGIVGEVPWMAKNQVLRELQYEHPAKSLFQTNGRNR